MSNTSDEHAQVGALLARCESFDVDLIGDEWVATIQLPGCRFRNVESGPTQLAAIRAAVEAAEKGVS